MRHERRIFKNTVFLTLGRGIGDFSAFIFLALFARTFGAPVLGEYSLAMSIGAVAAIAVSFGLNTPLIRDISREPKMSPVYVGSLLVTQAVFALVVGLFLLGLAIMMDLGAQGRAILMLIGTYHVVYRLSLITRAQFSAHQKMQYPALLEASHKILILVLGTAAICLHGSPVAALSTYPIGALAVFFAGLLLSIQHFGWPVLAPDIALIMRRLRGAVSFFVILVVAALYDRLGIVLLHALHGQQAIGVYSSAERLTVAVAIGFNMFSGAILPVLSRLNTESKGELEKLYRRCLRLVMVTALPAATLIFLLRGPIIWAVFGGSFQTATGVLGILSWGVVLQGLNPLLFSLMVACNLQLQLLKTQLIALAFFLAAALLVIPGSGYLGLAWCVLSSELLLFLIRHNVVVRNVLRAPVLKLAQGPTLACLAALSVYYLLHGMGQSIQLLLAIAAGAVGMWVFKAVQMHDLLFLHRILAREASSPAAD